MNRTERNPLYGRWRNVGTDPVPAYGIVKVIGTEVADNGEIIYLCQKSDGAPERHVVNQNSPVAPRREGTYYLPEDTVHPLLLDTSRVPAIGARIGPQPDSYNASHNSDGWQVLSTTSFAELVIVTANISSFGLLAIVETTDDHEQDDWQDCYLLTGPKGSEEKVDDPAGGEDPYVKIECYNRFDDVSAELKGIAVYAINGWELLAFPCE